MFECCTHWIAQYTTQWEKSKKLRADLRKIIVLFNNKMLFKNKLRPRPLNFLLMIMIVYRWYLLCAQHKKDLFHKCKSKWGVITSPDSRGKLRLSLSVMRKLFWMIRSNSAANKAQTCNELKADGTQVSLSTAVLHHFRLRGCSPCKKGWSIQLPTWTK